MSSSSNPTRRKILSAARALLESGGASQVRMSDIAKAASISRQALYLHFPNRAELLIALTRWMDEDSDIDARLAPSRAATGTARMTAFIAAWGNYIPEIYGVGKALMAIMDSDTEARAAWEDRMQAVRHGCAAAVRALAEAGVLRPDLSEERATDLLWTLLSVRNWEQFRQACGWSQTEYIEEVQMLAHRALVSD